MHLQRIKGALQVDDFRGERTRAADCSTDVKHGGSQARLQTEFKIILGKIEAPVDSNVSCVCSSELGCD